MGEKKNKRGAVGQKWTQVTGVGSGAQGERNSLLYACLCVCFRARERERANERTREGKGEESWKEKKKDMFTVAPASMPTFLYSYLLWLYRQLFTATTHT